MTSDIFFDTQPQIYIKVYFYDEILKKHPEWQLFDRYIDEGITGTSIRKRPKFCSKFQ